MPSRLRGNANSNTDPHADSDTNRHSVSDPNADVNPDAAHITDPNPKSLQRSLLGGIDA